MADKLKLLVLPDLFPAYEGDWTGVFVVDYLKCVQDSCDIQVFYSRLAGNQTGITDELFEQEFKVRRYTMLDKKPKGVFKLTAYSKWMKQSVAEAMKLPKPDVIHAHSAVLYGSLGLKLAEAWNVPLVVSEHTGPFSQVSSNALKLKKAKKVMASADATLAVSQHLANEIKEAGIKPRNLIVSGNPVDTKLFTRKSDGSNKRMVFISRLDEFKGGLRTLKAFHSIAQQFPDWSILIGGAGEEKEAIHSYVAENNLEEKVELVGKLTKPQIAEQFHRCDFFIFPSVHESFGLIPVEAMSAGLPVIATNKTAPPEVVNASNGLTVEPTSVEQIAKAMKQMIGQLQAFDRAKISGDIETKFGFDAFGKQLLSIYNSVR